MSDKLKEFTNYIKQDFDIVEDYKDSKEIKIAKCLTDEYCDFTKGKTYEIYAIDEKENYYKFANDKGETQWLRFSQVEIINVIKDSTVEIKPGQCIRQHCVIENDTCDNYMGVNLCALESKDITPKEAFVKILEIAMDVIPLNMINEEIDSVEQALSQNETLVKGVQSLVEKWNELREVSKINKDNDIGLIVTSQFLNDLKQLLEEEKV